MRIATKLTLALAIVTITAEQAGSESNVARAEEHLRKACELVWAGAAYQVERCTRRAMAALSEHNELRDNELKRLLLDSENALESCQSQLGREREELPRRETEREPLTEERQRTPI